MKSYTIPRTNLEVSRLAFGCMTLTHQWGEPEPTVEEKTSVVKVIGKALEGGINLFDHADIYGGGKSEILFAHAVKELGIKREELLLQSKCGIRSGYYDFDYEYICSSAEKSLKRLETDYLDLYLLHRPDALIEPEEVARAFDKLHGEGKVRHFGVSNHNAAQIELLQKYLSQPIVVNQIELNILHSYAITDGLVANCTNGHYAAFSGTLDYCRLNEISVQAWSPVASGKLFKVSDDGPDKVRNTVKAIAELAAKKGTTVEAIALSWLLRHPANILPVFGSNNLERIESSLKADSVELTREEWYHLLIAGRGAGLP